MASTLSELVVRAYAYVGALNTDIDATGLPNATVVPPTTASLKPVLVAVIKCSVAQDMAVGGATSYDRDVDRRHLQHLQGTSIIERRYVLTMI
ncbi:hypothetical protein GSI_09347 [Ganoderma sinense ZZ0214-1]|uniref:Uncharacterized protein n=1 Tax=Ganoderma sinense ZZ0214-1 TaxID=1077348 RepID=A0A2G8S696_9APHY|nr:hypothetical protein GSI_09347 [Ganoderma sinense ZZ0214-1]